MYDIKVGRFAEDPEAQGVVRPADGSWQLVVDRGGVPHLYVRARLEQEAAGDPAEGMLCVDDLLPDGAKVRDLMAGSFGGRLSPEEEAAAHAEYVGSTSPAGRRTRSPAPGRTPRRLAAP